MKAIYHNGTNQVNINLMAFGMEFRNADGTVFPGRTQRGRGFPVKESLPVNLFEYIAFSHREHMKSLLRIDPV